MNYSTLISVSYSFSLADIVVSSLHAAYYKRDLPTLRGKMLCCFINTIDAIFVALKLTKVPVSSLMRIEY